MPRLVDSSNFTNIVNLPYGQPLTVVFSTFSILGTLGIVLSYWMCPNERNTVRQLLLGLSLSDSLIAATNIASAMDTVTLGWMEPDKTRIFNHSLCNLPMYRCIAQSFTNSTSCLVSYFYTIVIASYFYVVGVHGIHKGVHKRLVWVHLLCWVIPLTVNMIALAFGALGPGIWIATGPWCWISSCELSNTGQIIWMTLDGQIWLIIAYVACPIFYFFLWRDVRHQNKRMLRPFATVNERKLCNRRHMFRPEDSNFRYTPFVLYLLRMWGTIRYILACMELYQDAFIPIPHKLNTFLFCMQCIGDNAQGLGNFIVFCVFDATIRKTVYQRIVKRSSTAEDSVTGGHESRDFDEASGLIDSNT